MFEVNPVVRKIKIFKESVVKALANKDIEDNPEQDGKWESVLEPDTPMDVRITEWAEQENAVVVDVFVNTYYESASPGEYTVNTTYIVAYMPFDSFMQFNRAMTLVTRNAVTQPTASSAKSQSTPTTPVTGPSKPYYLPKIKGATPWQTPQTPDQILEEATEALKIQQQALRKKLEMPPTLRNL